MKDPTLLTVLWAVIVALAGIVGVTVRSILTGRLVPRSALDDARADRDKWETACQTKELVISEFAGRLEANSEAMRLNTALLEALVARGPVR